MLQALVLSPPEADLAGLDRLFSVTLGDTGGRVRPLVFINVHRVNSLLQIAKSSALQNTPNKLYYLQVQITHTHWGVGDTRTKYIFD